MSTLNYTQSQFITDLQSEKSANAAVDAAQDSTLAQKYSDLDAATVAAAAKALADARAQNANTQAAEKASIFTARAERDGKLNAQIELVTQSLPANAVASVEIPDAPAASA